jgi:very-short-patch-repair endonuclease
LAGFKFRRQQPLERYIVDFFCEQAGIAIEADGQQHYPPPDRDVQRDRFLTSAGILVLRFPNEQILHRTDEVLQVICRALQVRCPDGPA